MILDKDTYTFVDKYLRGLAKMDDILSYIANWHNTDHDVSLPDYLGLTNEEHLAFVENDESLKSLLNEKRVNFRRSQFKLVVTKEVDDKEKSA